MLTLLRHMVIVVKCTSTFPVCNVQRATRSLSPLTIAILVRTRQQQKACRTPKGDPCFLLRLQTATNPLPTYLRQRAYYVSRVCANAARESKAEEILRPDMRNDTRLPGPRPHTHQNVYRSPVRLSAHEPAAGSAVSPVSSRQSLIFIPPCTQTFYMYYR